MPRTPAPLTVEDAKGSYLGLPWVVKNADGFGIAEFEEEADARAFVALPALVKVLRAVEFVADGLDYPARCPMCAGLYEGPYMGHAKHCELAAALAQADGPSPKE